MRVAITGGIGEGKSTVLGILARLGYSTASADEVARRVFERPDVNAALGRAAGLAPPLAREDLRAAIGASAEVRQAVNRITHPLILDELRAADAQFLEIPLLVEGCHYAEYDQVWVVTCGLREQRRRLLERYGDAVPVDALLATQLPTRVKIAFADRVIRTNRSLTSVTGVVSVAASGLRL